MNIFKKKEKINELNRLLIDELIEDIVINENRNIKVIFKCEVLRNFRGYCRKPSIKIRIVTHLRGHHPYIFYLLQKTIY